MKSWLKRFLAVLAISTTSVLGIATLSGTPTSAWSTTQSLDTWHAALSFQCHVASICEDEDAVFSGSADLTRDAATGATHADAELTGAFAAVPGVGATGAQHFKVDSSGWIIQPGEAGPQTFFLTTGTMTFTGQDGRPVTVPLINDDGSLVTPENPLETSISAVPGHYSTTEILGFSAPGISADLQVTYSPAQ